MRNLRLLVLLIILAFFSSCKDKRGMTVTRIQSVAKLATTETTIEKIVIGNKTKKFLVFFTIGEARFVCFSKATVKAGIDLRKLTKNDVKIEGKQIELRLPPVEVINFSYPFESFRIDSLLLDNGIFCRIGIEDMEELLRRSELDIRAQLPMMGIIEATENKTRQMMESLLRTLGYDDIYITFRKGPFLPKVDLKNQQL